MSISDWSSDVCSSDLLDMGSSWRVGVDPGEHTDLVTTGIFARVRNPIFTAMVITAAGLALVVANIVAVAGLAALIIALHIQVRAVAEPYLRERHGAAYPTHAPPTGRFLPRPTGRASGRETG